MRFGVAETDWAVRFVMASHNNTRGGKKKRSFLYKARKYGKKGMFGRGKNVDEETYNYFVRVMERLKEEFEDENDKGFYFYQTCSSI